MLKKKKTVSEAMADAAIALKKKGVVLSDVKPCGKITGCIPTGSCVLVELLGLQELQGTKLFMPDDAKGKDCEQAYVLALGPKVPSDVGFKVGDRVMLQGTGANPVPQFCEGRKMNLIEPHIIRCVLTEE